MEKLHPNKAKRQDCADCLYPERSCSQCINKTKEPKQSKKECWRCKGKGEVMPSAKMFLTTLGFMDAEPVPCPICHPEYWVKYPIEKQWTIEG